MWYFLVYELTPWRIAVNGYRQYSAGKEPKTEYYEFAVPKTAPKPRPRLLGKKLGNSIYMSRAVHLMTQADLAQQVGVSRQTISNIEAGLKQPSVGLALAIAKVLDNSVEELFSLR